MLANPPIKKSTAVPVKGTVSAHPVTTGTVVPPPSGSAYDIQVWGLLTRGYSTDSAIPTGVQHAAREILQYQRWLQQVSAWGRRYPETPAARLQAALRASSSTAFYEASALAAALEAYEQKYWRGKGHANSATASLSKRAERVQTLWQALDRALQQAVNAWPTAEGALSKDLLTPLQTLAESVTRLSKQIPQAIPAALHDLSECSVAPISVLLAQAATLPAALKDALLTIKKNYDRLLASRLPVARFEAHLQRQLRKAQETVRQQQAQEWQGVIEQAKKQGLQLPLPDAKATAAVEWIKKVRKTLVQPEKPLATAAYRQLNQTLLAAFKRWLALEAFLNPPRFIRVLTRTPGWSALAASSEPTMTEAALPLIEYNLEQLVMTLQGLTPDNPRHALLQGLAHKVVGTVLKNPSWSWSAMQALLPLAALSEPAPGPQSTWREPVVKQLLQSVLGRLQQAVLLDARWLYFVAALIRYSTLKPIQPKRQAKPTDLAQQALTVSTGKADVSEAPSVVPSLSLDSDDFVKILNVLQQHLQRLHVDSSTQTKLLGLLEGLNELLNAMIDHNVSGIDDADTQALASTLRSLSKDEGLHPTCRYRAAYAREALARIPTDTSVYAKSFGLVYRTATTVMNIASAAQSWDITQALEGVQTLIGLGQEAKALYDQHATSGHYEMLRLLDARFPQVNTVAEVNTFLRFLRALAQQTQTLAQAPATGPNAEAAKARAKQMAEGLKHEQVAYAIVQRLVNALHQHPEALAQLVYPWLFNLAGLAHSDYKGETATSTSLSIGLPQSKNTTLETVTAFVRDPRLPPLVVLAAYQAMPALLVRSKPSLLVVQTVYTALRQLPAVTDSLWLQTDLSLPVALEAHYRQQLQSHALGHLKSKNESAWRRLTGVLEKAMALDPKAEQADLTENATLLTGQQLLADNTAVRQVGHQLFQEAYQSEPAYWVELIEQQQREIAKAEGEDLVLRYVPLEAASRLEDLEAVAKASEPNQATSQSMPVMASKEGKQEVQAVPATLTPLNIATNQLLFNLREKLMRELMVQALATAQSSQSLSSPLPLAPVALTLIQAPAGAGKSSFGRMLIHDLWRFRQGLLSAETVLGVNELNEEDRKNITQFQQLNFIPLFIKLGALADPTRRCIEQVLEGMGCSESGIQQLKKEARFIFFFDGYDEVKTQKNLYQSNALHEWNAQIIITCRLGTLGKDYQSLFTVGKGDQSTVQAQEYYVAPFNETQIARYILQDCRQRDPQQRSWLRYEREQAQGVKATVASGRHAEDYQAWQQIVAQRAQETRQALRQLPGIESLIRTPFVLKVILNVLPELQIEQAKHKSVLNRTKVYQAFVQKWYAREARKLQASTLALRSTFHIEGSFQAFAEDFALTLMQHGRTIAPYLADQYYSPEVRKHNSWVRFANQAKAEVVAARSGVPLTLTRTSLQFLHKSLLEYYTACALLQEIPPYDPENTQFRPTQWFNVLDLVKETAVMDFLNELIERDADRLETLFQMILASRDVPERAHQGQAYQRMASNAATLLAHLRVSFSGRDLQGVRIPGANLVQAILHGVNLSKADLSHVNLTQAWLNEANLQGANLTGAQFGERPYLQLVHGDETGGKIAYSPDGRWLAGLPTIQGSLGVWEVATGELVQTFGKSLFNTGDVVFNPDSQWVAASGNGGLYLWNIKTGEERFFKGHGGRSMAFSPDGQWLASANSSSDNAVRLLNISTGAERILLGHTSYVYTVAFSPDGKQLASGSDDRTLRLWNLDTSESRVLSKDKVIALKLAFSSDGKFLTANDYSGNTDVRLWQVETGTVITLAEQVKYGAAIMTVTFSPDDQWLAFSKDDKKVRLWNIKNGEVRILSGHAGIVRCIAFSPDGQLLATGSDDKTVRLWDVKTGKGRSLSGHMQSVYLVAFSPDGQQLASCSGDRRVHIWDVKNTEDRMVSAHTGKIAAILSNSKSHQFASVSLDKTIRVWDIESGEARMLGCADSQWEDVLNPSFLNKLGEMIENRARDTDIAVSKDGQRIASCPPTENNYRGMAWVLEAKTSQKRDLFGATIPQVYSIALSEDGLQLASTNNEGKIKVWNIETRQELLLVGHKRDVTPRMMFSPDGKFLLSSGDNVRLWDLCSGESSILNIRPPMAFSPDGQQLALTGSHYLGDYVILYNIQSGESRVLSKLSEHVPTILLMAFSPDGLWVASGSSLSITNGGGMVHVWDVKSGRCLIKLLNGFSTVSNLAWKLPYLIVGDESGSLFCWSLQRKDHALVAQLLWRSGSASGGLVLKDCQIEDVQGLSPLNAALLKQRGAVGNPGLVQAKPNAQLSQHPASFVANIGAKTGSSNVNNNTQASSQLESVTATGNSTGLMLKPS